MNYIFQQLNNQSELKKFVLIKMDNPNFGSSHLSSPALVVFSQAANGLSDALRLQRPFHSQVNKSDFKLMCLKY